MSRTGVDSSDQGAGRSLRDSSLFDVAIGLYGVLFGLAIIEPIDSAASDILANPLRGDWGQRLLVVGLLILAARWFHALLAYMRLNHLSAEPRHPTLAGSRNIRPLYVNTEQLWEGAISVLLLILMASALRSKDLSQFLIVYLVKLSWSTVDSIINIVRYESVRTEWRLGLRVVRLLHRSRDSRYVPATNEDVKTMALADDQYTLAMWRDMTFYYFWTNVLGIMVGASLLAAELFGATSSTLLAGAWVAYVAIDVLVDYYLHPQLFAA